MAEAVPAAERRVAILLSVTVVLGAFLLWIALYSHQGPNRLIGIVGAVAALYTLIAYGPLLRGRPVLEAGPDGLVVHSGPVTSRMPWAEIEYVAVTEYHVLFWRAPALVVRIHDPRSREISLTRRARRSAIRRGAISVSLVFAAMSSSDVIDLIERRAGPGLVRSEDGQALIRP